ncbi:hypothetical protein [Reyranella sp.]|uniref:hypothetical protein n=1 Tax=Reyranella sp. TaxID=1929291 RepID=UPI0025FFB183|nr:hypothetical protein [Reyranella sp.]
MTTIASGEIGGFEYHLMREGSRKGKPFLEYKLENGSLWLWILDFELIVSRRR